MSAADCYEEANDSVSKLTDDVLKEIKDILKSDLSASAHISSTLTASLMTELLIEARAIRLLLSRKEI